MIIKKLLLFLVLHAVSLATIAQINESDTVKFQMRASLTGNYQKGNVEILSLRSKLDASYAPGKKNFVFKSQNSSLYQAFYSNKVDNDLYSRNFIYYKPEHTVYTLGIAFISTNYRRKVSIRYFTGGGVTYQPLHTKDHVIKIAFNAIYEQTKFKDTVYNFSEYNGSNKIDVVRTTLFLGGWSYLLQKHLRLFYDVYWQPSINNKNNYRLQVDFNADYPLWKGLFFTAAYTFSHDNIVVDKIKQEDRILSFGLAYNLKTQK
ncbi:MAG TPA: DUF481 domain-containing protein [Chitinophagaceae bacterium]|nr:DUF481 domain-containing protein [Chitinophagaceae bacterium]